MFREAFCINYSAQVVQRHAYHYGRNPGTCSNTKALFSLTLFSAPCVLLPQPFPSPLAALLQAASYSPCTSLPWPYAIPLYVSQRFGISWRSCLLEKIVILPPQVKNSPHLLFKQGGELCRDANTEENEGRDFSSALAGLTSQCIITRIYGI